MQRTKFPTTADITPHQVLELSVIANVYPRTAKKWLDPSSRPRMKPSIAARIENAAIKLGFAYTQRVAR